MAAATPNYSSGNDRFDAEAAQWDTQPEVVKSSAQCLDTLLTKAEQHGIQLASSDVLEIGCGTGLLTVPLSSHVASITALDTAQGMITMLDAKLSQNRISNVRAAVQLLENPQDPVLQGKQFDLAVSHLVFHHVPIMKHLVNVMFGTLKPGGHIWISDFEDTGPQALLFHPKAKHAGVERHGLLRQEMHNILTQVGFKDVHVFESFRMDKQVETGETMAFPFLAITGVRP
ncbi:S-adenosyl-L-methionine-dependent methyltransferase [Testicularia cyperi]|uniref:S-adenosyl-L-methionine-dependent methyltransferase n=1 Tax=Testicularia cyperi TaxID=1882483 RepID=A0A317XZU7_9BASI|nr:S-adenosyl-L-methionine-dependent methyltransferase [Testicularia cyperi]